MESMLDWAGIDRRSEPARHELVIDQDGHRSVYFVVPADDGSVHSRSLDGVLRSLGLAAECGECEVSRLVDWARSLRLTNLSFGLDCLGEPFVNLVGVRKY